VEPPWQSRLARFHWSRCRACGIRGPQGPLKPFYLLFSFDEGSSDLRLTQIGIIAILAAIVGLYQIYLQVGSMTQGAQQLVSSVQQTIAPAGGDAKTALEKIAGTQMQIDRINQQIEQLRNELNSATKKKTP
jgi:hypothetical protein